MPFSVFVGSASEDALQLATPIAQAIESSGLKVLRWWSDEVFRPGDTILLRLMQIARTVDAAVLCCTGTDAKESRGYKFASVRDNLLLELGLFTGAVSPKRCIVVCDDKVTLPSDMDGIVVLRLQPNNIVTIAEKCVHHLQALATQRPEIPPYPNVLVVDADPKVADKMGPGPLPDDWSQRALYLGFAGAMRWTDIVRDPTVLDARDRERRNQQLLGAIRQLKPAPDVFVSLGPGDARKDEEVAFELRASLTAPLTYIPVDISDGLLLNAVSHMHQRAQVPLGILSDFEENLGFIWPRIRRAVGNRQTLIGLLGNTLGNLDRREFLFLSALSHYMNCGDVLVLGVSLRSDTWSIADEIALQKRNRTPVVTRFYANGLARQLTHPIEDILANYENRIDYREGHSDVPGASAVDIVDTVSERTAITIRRYSWERLAEFVKDRIGFSTVDVPDPFMFTGENIGAGTLVCHK